MAGNREEDALLEVIKTRRSIRRYSERAVPAEVIAQLLTAATWAPSAHNRQPWRFVVLTEPAARAALAQAMGDRLRADRVADGDPIEAVEADRARSFARLAGAPVVIVVSMTMADMDVYPDTRRKKAEYLMAAQSVAMAAQNLLLAAHAAGLGACWLCAPLFCGDTVRAVLELPDGWEPQALVTLGYPAAAGKPAQRQGVETVTLWR